LAKRGMLALNVEWLGMGQLREPSFTHYKMNQLDLCGTAGLAPFYLAMKRGLDIVLSLEHTDASRVAVSGLSGGGWQTIIISSLDTRVQLANPVAGYSSFLTRVRNLSDMGDSEQTPVDLATVADYSHLTAMMAPRGLLLTYNVKDNCCFASGHALPPLLEAATPAYKLYEAEKRLASHVNHDPGTHNFEQDNREALYRVIGEQFYEGSAEFNAKEIPSDDEVKTAEELSVPMPQENHNFNTLALLLAEKLPRNPTLPADKAAAAEWQQQRRTGLKEIVKAKDYQVTAQSAGEETKAEGKLQATYWRLRIGDAWTVPAVELTRNAAAAPQGTTLLVADGGRTSVAAEAEKLLAAGQRVVAVDPFYFGESKIDKRDMLFGLLVSAVGDRPLGLQASQVAAIARWLSKEKGRNLGPVTIVAVGPRSSLFALVAAGLEERAIAKLELRQSYGSLKEIIEQNQSVDKTPELFTFGLLEQFDIRQLAALAAPRPIDFPEASDRAKSELKDLNAWYTLFGGKFGPLE
jgi:hypothetical protein